MNKFDRLESWIHDLQAERRPREVPQDDEDASLLAALRVMKSCARSRTSVSNAFDGQMRTRLALAAERKRNGVRVSDRSRSEQQADAWQRGGSGFFLFRPQWMFTGALAAIVVVVGVVFMMQRPAGDSIFDVAWNQLNSGVLNRGNGGVNRSPLANNQTKDQKKKNTNSGGVIPNGNVNPLPSNANVNVNDNGDEKNSPSDPLEEPKNGTPPPSDDPRTPEPEPTEPSKSGLVDLTGLQNRQKNFSVSLASVNQEFEDLESDVALASMTEDFNSVSF